MRTQPLEATYNNFGYQGLLAACYCKIDKYIRRDKGIHLTNLRKARHVLDILIEHAVKEEQLESEVRGPTVPTANGVPLSDKCGWISPSFPTKDEEEIFRAGGSTVDKR
jgi:hypothetical protein